MAIATLAAGAGLWIGLIAILFLGAVAAWVGFRATYSEHLPAIRGIPLFTRLSDPQVRSVARLVRRVGYAPGQSVVKAGEPGKGFFLIQEGTAKVLVDGQEKATLGRGGYFGEISLLDGGPRSASVVAETAVTVLELPSSKFLGLLSQDSSIGDGIYAELQRRVPVEGGKAGTGRVTREQLADLCRRLRQAETPDWSQAH